MTMVRVSDWLAASAAKLSPVEFPRLEANLILSSVLDVKKSWLLANPDFLLPAGALARADVLLDRRISGEPLPYLLGEWEFFGLSLHVTPAVLIPRPETEILVEAALAYLERTQPASALDLGTGSGCIPIAITANNAAVRFTATDISAQALTIARLNADRYGLRDRLALVQADLASCFTGKFSLITANLPYIPSTDLAGMDVAAHEPRLALDGGSDGLDLNKRLLQHARWLLCNPGLLLLEMQYDQSDPLYVYAQFIFPDAEISILPDLAGLPRVLRLELK